MNYTCDCCKKDLNNHPTNGHVRSSAYGPVSYRYCDECLTGGIEPYEGIVSYIACVGNKITDVNEAYQMSIMENLLFYKKSITQFEKDLKESNDAFMEAMDKMYNAKDDFEEMDRELEESERNMEREDPFVFSAEDESTITVSVPQFEEQEIVDDSTPAYLREYKLMDIYSPEGTKVRYLGINGYDSDKEYANKYLKPGEIYTVERTIVSGWSSDVILEEFPNEEFNTVMFSTVEEVVVNDK